MNNRGFDYESDSDSSNKNYEAGAVKKAEANMHAILDNADSGYALYDADLRVLSYNLLAQKFSELLYSKRLKEGNYLLDYFPPERHPILLDITKKVLAGEEVHYETHFEGLRDGEKWIDVKWISVKNSDNENCGFILVSKDITQNKHMAIEREKMIAELLRSNKAREQFTQITSHNLNAPVANIITLAETFNQLDDEDEKKQYVDYILSSAKSLQQVIYDINQILHIRQDLNEIKEDVDLDRLLSNIKSIIRSDMAREKAVIKCRFGITHVTGMPSYLHSIFYNMILNSIKYRRPDVAPRIYITARVIDNKTVLSFKDNGKGIDLKKHGAKLFGLYNRFDHTIEGRGLGLFMIKSQIEQLGGTINVESTPGAGTTFIVELPIS